MILMWIMTVLSFAILCRAYAVIPPSHPKQKPRQKRRRDETCHLAVFLGSGGHTSEALLLLSSVDFVRYAPRTYVVSEGDTISVKRAQAFESSKNAKSPAKENYTILSIPRARRVYQSLFATPPTALKSLFTCIYHVCIRPMFTRRPFADVLLVNGPGTCVMLCAAVYFSRVLFIPNPRMIYVESFARVGSLSLSGRLLQPFVDKFIVQWPESLKDGYRGECRGWLV